MSYRLKIALVMAFSALAVSAGAALSVWAVDATERHLRQADIAHELLNEHLQLSVHAYRLFKQLTDEILLGSGANQSVVRNKRAAIADSIARIRALELEQRAALGARQVPGAVEDTDDLERQIEEIIAEFESIVALPPGPSRAERVNVTLEDRIDIGFREAVNAALDRQRRVVLKMNQRVSAVHSRLIGFSISLVVATLLGALAMGWLLVRGIATPLDGLRGAAESLGRGELRHRAPTGFDVEFDRIAETFNDMAQRLESHQQEREQAQRALEAAVEERTEELSQANRELQRADAVRRQFFADVSHELRTPLTVIRGESQVALRGHERSGEDYRQALSVVLEQSIGLSRLVDDMLFIARTDAERIRIHRQTIRMSQVVEAVTGELAGLAQTRGVRIEPELDPDAAELVADPDRVRQLLIILIDNAIRFSPPDGAVRVVSARRDDQLELAVIDRGVGIDEQDLPHIFDRFFRAQSERGEAGHGQGQGHGHGHGLGLGLAVAKAIVAAHGGEILADSAPGRGTTITARFPLTS